MFVVSLATLFTLHNVLLSVGQYGLDTSEFTYNPSDPNRYQQQQPIQAEERSGGCTIM
jgi:hypothetical protein